MYLLIANATIKNMQARSIYFPANHTTGGTILQTSASITIAKKHATLPTCAEVITLYCRGTAPDTNDIVDSNHAFCLKRGASVGRGIVLFWKK